MTLFQQSFLGFLFLAPLPPAADQLAADPVLITNDHKMSVKVCVYPSSDRNLIRDGKCWKLKKRQTIRWDRAPEFRKFDVAIFEGGLFEVFICDRRRVADVYRLSLAPGKNGRCLTSKSKDRVAEKSWNAGDRVLGNRGMDNYWYPATVIGTASNRYELHYADGQRSFELPSYVAADTIARGSAVMGNWKRQGRWYPGRVSERKDDQLAVRYDDGFSESLGLDAIRVTLGKTSSAPRGED